MHQIVFRLRLCPDPTMVELTYPQLVEGVGLPGKRKERGKGGLPLPMRKGKERKSIYIAPFIYYVYLKAFRHGLHSFTCKYTMPAFPS